mmetsp:Transcript_18142/g.45054  ORF Transcript_18142/g.45054 Transcript_18142/m.45054 type:complete len:222 (+) Transcript_18142:132-797(+)
MHVHDQLPVPCRGLAVHCLDPPTVIVFTTVLAPVVTPGFEDRSGKRSGRPCCSFAVLTTVPCWPRCAPHQYLVHAREGLDVLHLVVQGLAVHGAVVDPHLAFLVDEADGVLHPVLVVAGGKVLAGVRAAALLPLLRRVHGDLRVGHQVVQLKRLDEVGVPHQASISHRQIVQPGRDVVDLDAPRCQRLLRAEHRGVVLHHPLHRLAHRRCGVLPAGVAHRV